MPNILQAASVSGRSGELEFRKTFSHSTDVEHTYKEQCHFATVKLRLEPGGPDTGNVFLSEVFRGPPWDQFIAGVEEGVRSVWTSLCLTDTKVSLVGGAFHESKSSTTAFMIAARSAMLQGCETAGLKLVEPTLGAKVTASAG